MCVCVCMCNIVVLILQILGCTNVCIYAWFCNKTETISHITHVAPNVYYNNTLHMYICKHMHMYTVVLCVYVLIQTKLYDKLNYILICVCVCAHI